MLSLVVHVYGTPYGMGYAQGSLLKDFIQSILPAFYKQLEEEVEQYLQFLPQELRDFIAKYGLEGALELTYLITER